MYLYSSNIAKKTSRYVSMIKRPLTHTQTRTWKQTHTQTQKFLSGDGSGAMGPTEYEISFAQKNENAGK